MRRLRRLLLRLFRRRPFKPVVVSSEVAGLISSGSFIGIVELERIRREWRDLHEQGYGHEDDTLTIGDKTYHMKTIKLRK